MEAVKVRNINIGEEVPKICVPVVGVTKEEILAAAETMKDIPVDVVEWRVDWFEHVFEIEKVIEAAREIREALGEIPFLFTFRTKKEGGEKEIGPEAYTELIQKVSESGFVDMVDIELFTGDVIVKNTIQVVHEYGVKVIISNHDFDKTPGKEEIINRLKKMQELGADIPKIAVMPNEKKDVLTLLDATREMYENYAEKPLITMSMAGMGVVSRLCGEEFGSALTFGAAGKASAPGQISVEKLKNVLTLLHECRA